MTMKKYTTILLTAILILTAAAFSAQAQAEADSPTVVNDMFADAMTLTLNGTSVGQNGLTLGATKEAGEPNHAENAGGKSVWFKFISAETRVVRINTMETNFDTLLAVYTGASVNNLTLVG
jgi:hypothetical protein